MNQLKLPVGVLLAIVFLIRIPETIRGFSARWSTGSYGEAIGGLIGAVIILLLSIWLIKTGRKITGAKSATPLSPTDKK
ncbi:MAG: hypothetical protein Q8P27_01625 [Candidatus Peregrinibacteria bacterium]|nr:hypothetical protein [Candidatus Peregrinibacteria bacterium]